MHEQLVHQKHFPPDSLYARNLFTTGPLCTINLSTRRHQKALDKIIIYIKLPLHQTSFTSENFNTRADISRSKPQEQGKTLQRVCNSKGFGETRIRAKVTRGNDSLMRGNWPESSWFENYWKLRFCKRILTTLCLDPNQLRCALGASKQFKTQCSEWLEVGNHQNTTRPYASWSELRYSSDIWD